MEARASRTVRRNSNLVVLLDSRLLRQAPAFDHPQSEFALPVPCPTSLLARFPAPQIPATSSSRRALHSWSQTRLSAPALNQPQGYTKPDAGSAHIFFSDS